MNYQRWELPRFDAPPERLPVAAPPPETKVVVPPILPPLPTAAELERLHQQAEEEGHRSGYQIGYQVGYEEGKRQVVQEVQHLQAVLENLQKHISGVDDAVVQAVFDLSLEVARQIVRETIRAKPEQLLVVIREALALLPHFNQSAHVTVHPEDMVLVRAAMGEQLSHSGWKLLEDASMERGGCRLDTAHSQIDASVGHRWKTVLASLGRDGEWLEKGS